MTITDSRPAIVNADPIHPPLGASTSLAAGEPSAPVALTPHGTATTGGRRTTAAHSVLAAGSTVPGPAAIHQPLPISAALLDPDGLLSFSADILDDLERVRIANENRLRQLTRTAVDADGAERGFGLDVTHPDVARLAAMVDALKKVEHDAELDLARKMRKHPLGPWVKATKGIGEKQGARLIAAIGDPYIRPEQYNEDGSVKSKEGPRTVSALWAYCGLHVLPGGHWTGDIHTSTAAGDQHRDTGQSELDARSPVAGVAAKRRKGERANWSTTAKTRAYLIAESCLKQLDSQCKASRASSDTRDGTAGPVLRHAGRDGHEVFATQARSAVPACSCSPYRVVYDDRRAHTAVTHPDWTDGHSHQDALRVASKAVLRDLWRAARDWHLAQNGEAT